MIRIKCKNRYCQNELTIPESVYSSSCEIKCPKCLGFTAIPKNEPSKQDPPIDMQRKKR
jgi:hypothetical protein